MRYAWILSKNPGGTCDDGNMNRATRPDADAPHSASSWTRSAAATTSPSAAGPRTRCAAGLVLLAIGAAAGLAADLEAAKAGAVASSSLALASEELANAKTLSARLGAELAALEAELVQVKEEEARLARLVKLDAPDWSKAAAALASLASEAVVMAEMAAMCDAGDTAACDNLSREEEAKKAWLAKLDVPTWSAAAAAVSAVATELTQARPEEEAKTAWLSRVEVPGREPSVKIK